MTGCDWIKFLIDMDFYFDKAALPPLSAFNSVGEYRSRAYSGGRWFDSSRAYL